MVVGSPDYISAMAVDLGNAISQAKNPDRFVIVSRGGIFIKGVLSTHVIPSDARLQHAVGGARTSLHVRVARKILKEVPDQGFTAAGLQAHYQRILAHSADAPTYDRTPLTDQQVERFILALTRQSAGISCTRALRALRDDGHACEQSRFKAIFHQATKIRHAS